MQRARSAWRLLLALAAILALAVGLRGVYLAHHTGIFDESQSQVTVARNILSGHWFEASALQLGAPNPASLPVDYRERLRPYIAEVMGPALVLAAVWEVTGSQRLLYGEVLQIALDVGVLLLVYRIVMLLFRRRGAALIAALLYAMCFPIARQTSIVDPDIWGLYFTVAILALYLEALGSQRHRGWWLLGCGLTVGAGAFFRANVLLLPLVLGFASVGWPGAKHPLRGAVAIFAIAVLLLVPWTIRNYIDFHRLIPVRSGAGMVLWEGLGEIHNDFGALDNDVGTYLQVERVRPDLEYLSPAYDEYLQQRAVHVIERHPLFYAELVGRRAVLSTVALYESAWMYRTGESPFLYRTRTGKGVVSYALNRPLSLLESMFDPAIFVLAMLALACTWRRYRREHLLLIVIVLSALVPYWLLHFEARYVLPTLAVYLIWIALGADLLGERVLCRVRLRRSPSGSYAET